MKRIAHRVESKRARKAPKPALPKEVVITGDRERIDRYGEQFNVVWRGSDGALENMKRGVSG